MIEILWHSNTPGMNEKKSLLLLKTNRILPYRLSQTHTVFFSNGSIHSSM